MGVLGHKEMAKMYILAVTITRLQLKQFLPKRKNRKCRGRKTKQTNKTSKQKDSVRQQNINIINSDLIGCTANTERVTKELTAGMGQSV